ncbi:uncharacterized protein LOC131009825 [Salvia miltiorrhiza]|uniref:uncharacterized protein LOC131009825 n=1 Tax=Salvia miltiorrhiza TaxID=226208 RepID=UPI0025AB9DD1|nr:uncharacterized protein LOC131009825 [Salvia miltiorrhiza]
MVGGGSSARGGSSGRGAASSAGHPTSSTGSDGGIAASVRDIQLTHSPSSSASVPTEASEATQTGRTTLIIKYGKLHPLGMVPSVVTKIFKQVQNPEGYSWKLTPLSVKTAYFEEFKKHFTWDAAIESAVYKLWHACAARRYSDFVHDIKERRSKRPPFIHEDHWPNWNKYWDSDEVKAKSEIAKKCRMSEPLGPGTGQAKHKGGSRSILQYAEEVGKRKGVEPTECLYDAYEILHKNKDGTYTDERSRRIGEKVQDIVVSQSQTVDDDSDPPEIDMNKVYVEAVGGLDKKKRMFGVGGLAASLRSSEQSSGTSQFQGPLVDPQRFMDVEQQLQDALVEIARQKEEMRQKDEQTDARFQAQQRMFEEILARLPPGPTGPTPPTGPSS